MDKWHREMRGWTEYELAVRAGLSQSIISTMVRERPGSNVAFDRKNLRGFCLHLLSFLGMGMARFKLQMSKKICLINGRP